MSTNPPGNLGGLLRLAASLSPAEPRRWTHTYHQEVLDRGRKRVQVLQERLDGVTQGRTLPDAEQVTIGSGRQLTLTILFLDICGFSAWPNWTSQEQKRVLAVMNIFMAEMLNIVRDFGGVYEKNTGDGLMAYFGEGATDNAERVRPAVEAAVVMHHFNDFVISPYLTHAGLPGVRFRVGLDMGPVTIARVGIRGDENSLVAIGTPANIACKLMNLIPQGGICIGRDVYDNLPPFWNFDTQPCTRATGFVYTLTGAPYPAWELTFRLAPPTRP